MFFFQKQKKKREYIEVSYMTHTGLVRKENQDNLCIDGTYLPMGHGNMDEIRTEEYSLDEILPLAVFDGMGGEADGEMASFLAAQGFSELINRRISKEKDLEEMLNLLNGIVCQTEIDGRKIKGGTTFTGLFFNQDRATFSNLGDRPSYMFREDVLSRMYESHTNAAFLKAMGITNRKPGLTQFLGLQETGLILKPYITTVKIQEDDIYLLCSDGVTDMVSEYDIITILKKESSATNIVKCLLDAALNNGGRDNISIVVCKVKKL